MDFHIAQINIARFRVPSDDPVNADFVGALDRVNALAERQPGFIWRLIGDGNDALDIDAFDDPNIAINMSVWTSIESLAAFVYRTPAHVEIMRRRTEWFDKIETSFALWWIPTGHRPSIEEGRERLRALETRGVSPTAFTFKDVQPMPSGLAVPPVMDECT